jgi:hypothetical protein
VAGVQNSGAWYEVERIYGNEYSTLTHTIRLGDRYLWVDASGRLRINTTAPAVLTDGTVVGTQT